MFEDLGKILKNVQIQYDAMCYKWEKINEGNAINLKKKLVVDIREDAKIFDTIWKYRSLLNDENLNIMVVLGGIKLEKSIIDGRVKAQNSIEYKIENYICSHEGGRIPIKKCFNDLFGVRVIINDDFEHSDIKKYVDENNLGYKCIDSSKNMYKATHIYFERGNLFFPWELQIWNKKDEETNYKSHKEYKQEYTKWENESKGGD